MQNYGQQRGNQSQKSGVDIYSTPTRGGNQNFTQSPIRNQDSQIPPGYSSQNQYPQGFPPGYPHPMAFMPPPPGFYPPPPYMGQRPGMPPPNMMPAGIPYPPMPPPGFPIPPPGYNPIVPPPGYPPMGYIPGGMPPPGMMPGMYPPPGKTPTHQFSTNSPGQNYLDMQHNQYQQSSYQMPLNPNRYSARNDPQFSQQMQYSNNGRDINIQQQYSNNSQQLQQGNNQQNTKLSSGLSAAAKFGIQAEAPSQKLASNPQQMQQQPIQQNPTPKYGQAGISAAAKLGISMQLPNDPKYTSQPQNINVDRENAIRNASKFGITAELPGEKKQDSQQFRQTALAAHYGINAQPPGSSSRIPNKEANVIIASEFGIKAEIPGMNKPKQQQHSQVSQIYPQQQPIQVQHNTQKLSLGKVGNMEKPSKSLSSFGISIQRPNQEPIEDQYQIQQQQEYQYQMLQQNQYQMPEKSSHRKKKRKSTLQSPTPLPSEVEIVEELLYDYGEVFPEDFERFLPDFIYEYIYQILDTVPDECLRLLTDLNLDEKMTQLSPEFVNSVKLHKINPSKYPMPEDPEPPELLQRRHRRDRKRKQALIIQKRTQISESYSDLDNEYEEEEPKSRSGLVISKGFIGKSQTKEETKKVTKEEKKSNKETKIEQKKVDELGPQFVIKKETQKQRQESFDEEFNEDFGGKVVLMKKQQKFEEEEEFDNMADDEDLGPSFVMDLNSNQQQDKDISTAFEQISQQEQVEIIQNQQTEEINQISNENETKNGEEIKPKEEEIVKQNIEEKKEEIKPKEEEIKSKEEEIKPKEEEIKSKEEEIKPKEEEIKPKEEEIVKQNIEEKKEEIDQPVQKQESIVEEENKEKVQEQKQIIENKMEEEEEQIPNDEDIQAEEEKPEDMVKPGEEEEEQKVEEEEDIDEMLGDIEYFQGSDGIIYDRFWPENEMIYEQLHEAFPITFASFYPEEYADYINHFIANARDFIHVSMDPNFDKQMTPVSKEDIEKALQKRKQTEDNKSITIQKSSDSSKQLKLGKSDTEQQNSIKNEVKSDKEEDLFKAFENDFDDDEYDEFKDVYVEGEEIEPPVVEKPNKEVKKKVEIRKMTEDEKKSIKEKTDLAEIAQPILTDEDEPVILSFPNSNENYIRSKDGKFIYKIPQGYENLPPDSLLEMLEDENCGKFTPVNIPQQLDDEEFINDQDDLPDSLFNTNEPKPKQIVLSSSNIVVERRKPGDPIPENIPVRFEDFEDDFDFEEDEFQVYHNPQFNNAPNNYGAGDIPPDMLEAMLGIPDDTNMYNEDELYLRRQAPQVKPGPIVVERPKKTQK